MKKTVKSFGKTKSGANASLFTFTNKNGMSVSFTDFGANIVSIIVPDKNGNFTDVLLGFDTLEGYEEHNRDNHGSFVGRYANRIANGEFTVGGKKYTLFKNDGKNTLHGGKTYYNTFMYDHEIIEDEGSLSVEFSRLSPDMEQGFPGNLDLSVTYTLTEENELIIEYFAASDKDTIVNFTNHSYFNLGGCSSGTAMNQYAKIYADAFTPADEGNIPTGEIRDVTGTPLDFRTSKRIGQEIDADYPCLKSAHGYDQNFVLNTKRGEASLAAELYDEPSGRLMEVFTDLPGLQFYAGNFIAPETGKGGHVYQKREGVCFESQFYPNACNTPSFPFEILKADEEFETVTVYKFSVK